MDIQNGTRFGRYEIAGIIAAGGMGEVYRARDTRLGREVAIKVLPHRLSSDASLRERLQREARAISTLSHPNICTLFDVGEEDGADYLVMEYLEGETLADRIARGPLPVDDVVRYGCEIAQAIAAAHRSGVVHRDLKPGNVMLTKPGAKVLDFGLAAIAAPETAVSETVEKPLTRTGHVLGTLQYMSPEQLRGDAVDARTDIFSLGAILFEMATGRRAFSGTQRDVPAHVEPPALDAVIRHCLAADPDDRFQSARDVALALQDIGRTKASKRPAVIAAAIALALIVTASALFLIARRTPARGDNRPNTIAVLPFANLGSDRTHDYLRLAIPDEITTILTYDPDLAVRPFSASRLFETNADPQLAAQKLNAAAIVSGHILDAAGRLNVTLEAIDVTADRLLWRDDFEVPAADLVTMRRELGSRIENGLMPKLTGGQPLHRAAAPTNDDAYTLFLQAAALGNEGDANREGLRLLRRAVAIDPRYANAWSEIALREYYDVSYGDGGPAARVRSMDAANRALQLDPDLPKAATRKIVIETESGATVDACRDARQLVERRPRSADAHFTLSYPLRYGGALQESARECDTANSLDPGNRLFRSCATTFAWLGDKQKEAVFERLDPDSGLMQRLHRSELMRQGKIDEAIAVPNPSGAVRTLLIAVRDRAPEQQLETLTATLVARSIRVDDGEADYGLAGLLAAAGRKDGALTLLRHAGSKNFCTVPAIDLDSLYDSIRSAPGYAEVHAAGVQCHDRFMAAMNEPHAVR